VRYLLMLAMLAVGLGSCSSSSGGSDVTDPGIEDPGTDPALPDLGMDLAMDGDAWREETPDPGTDTVTTIPCETTRDCDVLLEQGSRPCQEPFCGSDGTCRFAPVPNGTTCDDQDPCTTADQCRQGACVGVPTECDDGNACTADRCTTEGTCTHEPVDGACDDGNPCTEGDQCRDGQCVGGANACACEADQECPQDGDLCNGVLRCVQRVCILDLDSVVHCPPPESPCMEARCRPADGKCEEVPAGEGAPCDDGNSCSLGDHCQQGLCVGTTTVSCDDGNPCTDDTCDARQGCLHAFNEAPCDDGNACTEADTCRQGACLGRLTPRCGCQVDGDCESLEDGNRCNGILTCQEGICRVDPTTVITCDAAGLGPCRTAVCDPGTGKCIATNLSDDRPCDDGNACTTESRCQAGTCVGVGEPLRCDDGNECTADRCDPAVGCVFEPRSGACEDGNLCTENDFCEDGQCRSGTLKTCRDASPCTDDLCDPSLGCVFPFNEASCDDGDSCTVGDRCTDGRCRPGPRDPCDDNNPCTTDSCDADRGGCIHQANTDPCDDGNWCTVGDICAQKVCQPGTPRVCDDGNPCTKETCDPEGQRCLSEPDNEASCDDGRACTRDFCRDGQCTSIVACEDGNPCTEGLCDPETGECVQQGIQALCDDSDPCTVEDACTEEATCKGLPKDCEEGDFCTIDSCEPGTGECLHEPVSLDDGDLCTVDSCDPGTGEVTHVPVECSNHDACDGLETCNPMTGLCVPGTPIHCDDGNLCNGLESCNPTTGQCESGTPLNCDDANLCTLDECIATLGCRHMPLVGTTCNDRDLCTVNDQCQADGRCEGTPIDCSDGDACNGLETCDPLSGGCVAGVPVACDDQDVCNGVETCDPVTGKCVPGTALRCDDGNPCTDDLCDRVTGCYNPNNSAPCEDGRLCTTGDRCVGGECVSGGPKDCNDGIPCTEDSCVEGVGCVHVARDSACEDGNDCTDNFCDISAGGCRQVVRNGQPCDDHNACTVNDICLGTACLGVGLNCNDGIPCTDDYCDLETGCRNDPVHSRCDDRNSCTDNVCDPDQGGCVFPDNQDSCDDGNPCTLNDQCLYGTCIGGDPNPCDDQVACTEDVCQDYIGCQHIPVDDFCDDGNICTAEYCDASQGCVREGLSGGDCDDGDPCTRVDLCQQGRCEGSDVDPCDDGVACTKDSCVAGAGCRHDAQNDLCDDGASCTNDRCTDHGCEWTPLDGRCNDGNVCTADACLGANGGDPGTGCLHTPLTGDYGCDDQNLCTEGDLCVDGRCKGTEISCDDGTSCTVDSCDPGTGCQSVPNHFLCDDGIACTHDQCTNDGCQWEPDDTLCTDGIACTRDWCDPLQGGCVHEAQDGLCDDGTACTLDRCDPERDCIQTPQDDQCDDGVPCTVDACVSGVGCRNTADASLCDDGIACTLDFCDVAARQCANVPQDAACEDGLSCTANLCDPLNGNPATGCRVEPNDAVCDDGNPCTQDSCGDGPAPTGCRSVDLSDQDCDDGDACTLGDVCFQGRCLSGLVDCGRPECGNHACDDGDLCTVSSRCLYQGGGQGVCTFGVSACDRPDCAGYACDDGDSCTIAEACEADGSCLGHGRACWLPECAAHPDCPETDCFDGVDENQDGRTDCWDPSCRYQQGCLVTVAWCRLQWPLQITTVEGAPTTVFGRVYVPGVTTATGGTDLYPPLVAEVGYGPSGSHPDDGGWSWFPAQGNMAYGPDSPSYEASNDEYLGLLPGSPPPGADYAFRFSGDNGSVFVLCDKDARSEGRGDGSADGYDPQDAGKMITFTNLYFSEYVEGSSNNKAVEVFNAGSVAVPLSQIIVRVYANGATSPTSTIPLGTQGVLDPGATFVLCNSQAGSLLLPLCNGLSGSLSFNGDDAVELLGPDQVVLDVIGQIGFRPSTEWGTGLVSTADNTIRRKCEVVQGDRNGGDVFDPAPEWDGFPVDTFNGLGDRNCR